MLRSAWLRQLLLAALVLRALLPAGYMPGVDANGLPTLQLCSVLQPLSQRLADAEPSRSSPDGSRGAHSDSGPCPFGAAPVAASPAAGLSHAAPVALAQLARHRESPSDHSSPALHSQQARAPPVQV